MKFLLSITLVGVMMIQLSTAENAVKVVQPPKDKLYPFFEMIATSMNEYNKKEIPIIGSIYRTLLPEYTTYLESHNTKPYQDYKVGIEKFLKSVEQFENDLGNCNLQRAAKIDLTAMGRAQPADDDALDNMLQKAYQNKIYEQEYKNLIHGFTEQFPVLIKNFVESLNESEQQKYADFYKFGQEFLKASDDDTKFTAFQEFIDKLQFTENLTSANDENCKWDVTKFDQFLTNISVMFVDLNKIHF